MLIISAFTGGAKVKYLQNLHTHTTYADGIDSPEEMLEHAVKLGFDSIGFSEHSYMFYSESHSMSLSGTEDYKKEITLLKEKYRDVIKVFLGLEFDMYSKVDLSGYDYLIGSLHYFKFGDDYIGFDRSAEECRNIITTHFGGDGLKFAKEYYRQLALLPQYGNFDIIGHYDLVTKNIEKAPLFNTDSKEYITAALDCLSCLKGKIPFFEVNTGAISRGYRTSPYPAPFILKEMKNMGFGAVITSDCHNGKFLDCGYSNAAELLAAAGFKEYYILQDSGFKPEKLG